MIEINSKDKCCGCYGCVNICPKGCIEMRNDNEGFWYPKVDNNKCIKCNLCVKVCPILNNPIKEDDIKIAYACKNKNEKDRISSSSGGIFILLCKEIISKGGIVFGAAFDEKFNIKHSYAKTIKECKKFKGSKYVQSRIGNSYKLCKEFLEDGRVVMFSGTQCQIKGLNLFLGRKYENLITTEVICHGVPSPKVFKVYKKIIEKKHGLKIKNIEFRNKKLGWKRYSFVAKLENKQIYSKTLKEDIYMKGFLNDLYLRPSCYKCTAKNFVSNSDLSLADYWGVKEKHLNFDDDKGISLILVNSEKGKKMFDTILNNMEAVETDLQHAINNNKCIIRAVKYNPRRKKFFKQFNRNEQELESLIEKYIKPTFKYKVKLTLWTIKNNFINTLTKN